MLSTIRGLGRFGSLKSAPALVASRRGFADCPGCPGQHKLPDLPYDFNALEPVISAEIMQLHHGRHHATYVANLNVAEVKAAEAAAKGDHETLISLGPALRFNGGGHINHSIFWQNLAPKDCVGCMPSDLESAIVAQFGSVDELKRRLTSSAVGVQGSGWAWLGYHKDAKRLRLATCANQDPLEATHGMVPLLGIDVWEHAYYLQYKNVRPDYVNAIWDIVNWEDVAARFRKVS